MSNYLNQLKNHKESLEINLRQCENDIAHTERALILLKEQKEATEKQIVLTDESIAEEEDK